jgi:hypothetical protein
VLRSKLSLGQSACSFGHSRTRVLFGIVKHAMQALEDNQGPGNSVVCCHVIEIDIIFLHSLDLSYNFSTFIRLMRMFCSFPNGCAKMKNSENVSNTLDEMLSKEELFADVRDELTIIVNNLKPIERPQQVRVKGKLLFCGYLLYVTFLNA